MLHVPTGGEALWVRNLLCLNLLLGPQGAPEPGLLEVLVVCECGSDRTLFHDDEAGTIDQSPGLVWPITVESKRRLAKRLVNGYQGRTWTRFDELHRSPKAHADREAGESITGLGHDPFCHDDRGLLLGEPLPDAPGRFVKIVGGIEEGDSAVGIEENGLDHRSSTFGALYR